MTQGGTTTTFAYDGLGRRLKQTVGTTETRYLWCGAAICQQRSNTDTVQKRFFAEGEYVLTGTKKYLTLTDHLGSVRDLIDITGTPTLVGSFDYTPYGAVARSWGTVTPGYTYAGLFAHPQTGLLLSATRAYEPTKGRWLNRDSIRELGGINLYSYVRGNPLSRRDPMGLFDIFIGGAADSLAQPVKQFFDRIYYPTHPNSAYFGFDDADLIEAKIKDVLAQNPNEPINLIGHSYGGDTAGYIAASACETFGKKIDNLITIDPVGWFHSNYADIAAGSNNWVNVDAIGPGSGNFIAGLGGAWNGGPARYANTYIIDTGSSHADFGKMFTLVPGFGGR